MAVLLPQLSEEELDLLPSRAEARFYRACRSLPPGIVVLHSLGGVWATEAGHLRDGEADFVLLDADWGMLVVEVKGGGVGRDARTGRWHSVDRNGVRHEIKDPLGQASRQKYALLAEVRRDERWRRLRRGLNVGHAVALPDVADPSALAIPGWDLRLVAGAGDLDRLAAWHAAAVAACDARFPPPGRDGLAALREIFGGGLEARPSVSLRLADEESERLRLTREQARLLDFAAGHTRTSVAGGAGTGKTLLALEKARRLAAAGLRTLLLCYNRPLADDLRLRAAGVADLEVLGFHQLCDREVARVRADSGKDLVAEAREAEPGGDLFADHYPLALMLSATEGDGPRYDALVVDEGQDFSVNFWLALDAILADPDRGQLHVFHDTNQAVYGRCDPPVPQPPFALSVNCRSTRQIHNAAYRHYAGDATDAGGLDGVDVRYHRAEGLDRQAALIVREASRLVRDEGVPPHDVAVLVAAQRPAHHLGELRRLGLPGGNRWVGIGEAGGIVLDTVRRFKGLEAAVVFLWGLDQLRPGTGSDRETLYVGLSRGKSDLHVVGSAAACDRIEAATADAEQQGVDVAEFSAFSSTAQEE